MSLSWYNYKLLEELRCEFNWGWLWLDTTNFSLKIFEHFLIDFIFFDTTTRHFQHPKVSMSSLKACLDRRQINWGWWSKFFLIYFHKNKKLVTWTLSDNAISSTHDEWERIHFKMMMKLLSTPFRLCPWALNAFLGGLKEAFCVHVIHLIIISNYPHYFNVTYLALIISLFSFTIHALIYSPQELQFFCLSPSSLTWWLKQW